MTLALSPAARRIQTLIAQQDCVILDGGVSTELQRVGLQDHRLGDASLWGTWGLYHQPQTVLEVHRRFVAAGCDVISTNTWGILGAEEVEPRLVSDQGGPAHWMDSARLAVRLARKAVSQGGREGQTAVAFSIHGDIDRPQLLARLKLFARVFEDQPPDLILLETLSLIRDQFTWPAVEAMLATGLPVWLSFRRCRHGVCGIHGQHWGGPEGDRFGQAARRFEEMGVSALLINCLPVTHVPGMLPWLRDFTDMPLGVYPNLGRSLDPGWGFDESVRPEDYGRMALSWRAEGAQIIGGCCGTTPEHIAAAGASLRGTKPGRPRAAARQGESPQPDPGQGDARSPARLEAATLPWLDEQQRQVYPLDLPDLRVDPGVFEPTEGSFLVWKHLYRNGLGRGLRCLEIGCGCGILSIQMARNGATDVRAIDIQREAAANTMANAFRNQVESRVHATVGDLFTYEPPHPVDLVVASLYQMPVDPYRTNPGHRPQDFWGRSLMDHLLTRLPHWLAPGPGSQALVMQLSILSQWRTTELLEEGGLCARVVDFHTFPFSPVFLENIEQIRRVEELSDAYHLRMGTREAMVAYLVSITRKDQA